MNDWFVIKDLKGFVDGTRLLVFVNFGDNNGEEFNFTTIDQLNESDRNELNKILSHEEAFGIIKPHLTKQRNKKTKEIRYLVSDSTYVDMVTDLNQRIVSNLMTQLVNKGLVETAFDSEANDFVFWVKDYDKQEETPETD